jgi:hypothetical protein
MIKKGLHKKDKWKLIIGVLLFVFLSLSVVYAIIKIIQTPSSVTEEIEAQQRSDYILMLLQCLVGLVMMFIPSLVERRLSVDIPNKMEILFFIFLFCAIYLGEVGSFYYLIPHWDTILHAFSGAMLGALGFNLVSFMNRTEHLNVKLSPFFITMFAFCFALTCGALWEIYEFIADSVLGTNMQKFITGEGVVLAGRLAIQDTMYDIIVDALSALVITSIGYRTLRRNREKFVKTHENVPSIFGE